MKNTKADFDENVSKVFLFSTESSKRLKLEAIKLTVNGVMQISFSMSRAHLIFRLAKKK